MRSLFAKFRRDCGKRGCLCHQCKSSCQGCESHCQECKSHCRGCKSHFAKFRCDCSGRGCLWHQCKSHCRRCDRFSQNLDVIVVGAGAFGIDRVSQSIERMDISRRSHRNRKILRDRPHLLSFFNHFVLKTLVDFAE